MEQVGLEAFKVSMDDAVMVQSEPLRRQATALLTPRMDVPVIDVRGGMVRLISEGHRPAAPRAAQGCTICRIERQLRGAPRLRGGAARPLW